VNALLARLASCDASTEEHTRRVALLAAKVGDELKLSAASRRHLAVGGLLHDIGKLSVPIEILQKPGALTDEEFTAITRHPEDGRRLLEELGGFPVEVRRLVSDHHERLDGSGYPRGLAREELNIETRILAVCDVYDALVSDRVYRPAWTPERALALLHDEAHAYDPSSSPRSSTPSARAAERDGLGRRSVGPRGRRRPHDAPRHRVLAPLRRVSTRPVRGIFALMRTPLAAAVVPLLLALPAPAARRPCTRACRCRASRAHRRSPWWRARGWR
jgi:putative nucleotidyltransferase with HDIG domain